MRESIDLVTVVLVLLVITDGAGSNSSESNDGPGVSLISTLKQRSLCPGDDGVIFTCTAIGTDLTWIVGGRLMSYNAFATVGAIRSNAEFNDIAILMQVETMGDNGLTRRMSVLHVSARPDATEPLTVQCHNGTMHCAEEETFWCRESAPPPRPIIFNRVLDKEHANIAWEVTDIDQYQEIDHFIIQLDNNLPILVKNYSTTVVFGELSSDYTITVKAVNKCEQKGNTLTIPVNMFLPPSTTSSEGPDATMQDTTFDFPMYPDTGVNSAQSLLRQGYMSVNVPLLLITSSVQHLLLL